MGYLIGKNLTNCNITADSKGKVKAIGTDLSGVKYIVEIKGGLDENKKEIPFTVEDFKNNLSALVKSSTDKAIERAKDEKTKKELKAELKTRLESIKKGTDVSLSIDKMFGVYSPINKVFITNTIGSAIDLGDSKTYYNIKPIENNKNNKNYIPLKINAKAMVMKREAFEKLSEDEKSNIKYDKNSSNASDFTWKRVSASDLKYGRVDLATVKLESSLNRFHAKPNDLLSALKKDENYIKYLKKEFNKEFKASYSLVKKNEDSEKYVFPKTRFSVPQQKIFETVGVKDTKELIKKIVEKANESSEFFFPFADDNGEVTKVNHKNIDKIATPQLIKKMYNTLIEQFNNRTSQMLEFLGVEDEYSDTLKYLKIVDDLKNAPSFKEYVLSTQKLYKSVCEDGLSNVPLNINIPLKTFNYQKRADENYIMNYKQSINDLLGKMIKDTKTPLERTMVSLLNNNSNSQYMKNIKDSILRYIDYDKDSRTIEYLSDENGFTMEDRLMLSGLDGRVEDSKAFDMNGKMIEPLGFTALGVTEKEDKENYIGLTGVGGRKFGNQKINKILSSFGFNYVVMPKASSEIKQEDMPKLNINPLTGEEKSIEVKKVETVKDEKKKEDLESKTEEEKAVENIEIDEIEKNEEPILEDTPTEIEAEVTLSEPENIKEEAEALMGDLLDIDSLNAFLNDDEDLDIKVGNDIHSESQEFEQPNINASKITPNM